MNCRQWLKSEGRTQVWLAQTLGVHKTLVSHWLAGRRQIDATHAVAIHRLSGGRVTVSQWWNCADTSST